MFENKHQKSIARYLFVFVLALLMVVFCTGFVNAESGITMKAQVDAKGGAYLRKAATTNSAKVTLLKDNTPITIDREIFTTTNSYAKNKRWYHVTANGKTGYIRVDLVDSYQYPKNTAKVTGDLNYRYGAGTNFNRKGTFKKGTNLNVIMTVDSKQTSYDWYKIRQGSNCYYVSSNYISLGQSPVTSEKTEAEQPKEEVPETPAQPVVPDNNTSADNNPKANGNLTDEIVATRINQLYEALNGKYFTTDGKASGSSTDPRCNVVNVLAQNSEVRALNKKYKGAEAPATTSYMPGHYNMSSTYMLLGCSCCGFANYASWFIGADGTNEDVSCKLVVNSIDYTYSNMSKYARIGDVLRISGSYSGGHSVILVEVNQNGCVVLDANTSGDGQDGWNQAGKNRVYKHSVSWGNNKVAISRNKKR